MANYQRLRTIGFFILALFLLRVAVLCQGPASNQIKDSSDKADKNLRSVARINPSTLAMEFSLPLASYPGRNGNSVSSSLAYSSKVWRMTEAASYWYPQGTGCNQQYISQLRPRFGENSLSGWTSSMVPPVIEEKFEVYDRDGNIFKVGQEVAQFNSSFLAMMQNTVVGRALPPPTTCGWNCHYDCTSPDNPQIETCTCIDTYQDLSGCPVITPILVPTGCSGPGWTSPLNINLYYIKGVKVRFSNGSVTQFRAGDSPIECGTSLTGCQTDSSGTYLAVDGSGMRLVRSTSGSVLYLPGGTRYEFPATPQHSGDSGWAPFFATRSVDRNGNVTSFAETTIDDRVHFTDEDTLGREITDPLQSSSGQSYLQNGPIEEKKVVELPGLDGATQAYSLEWQHLKPVTCPPDTRVNCGNENGALEDQAQDLYHYTANMCWGSAYPLVDPNGNAGSPANLHPDQILFPNNGTGLLGCNPVESGSTIYNIVAARFNPVVLAEIGLPNGKTYQFKYNQFGEITRIIYPTGGYETFKYERIDPLNGFINVVYDQANRGVTEHRVYEADGTLVGRTQYSAGFTASNAVYKVTTTTPHQGTSLTQEPMVPGFRSERYIHARHDEIVRFGLDDPLAGMPVEERSYDENGVLRSRSLTEYDVKTVSVGSSVSSGITDARRDPRVKRTATIAFEPGSSDALATMGETTYDDGGSSDPGYFSQLNVKTQKGYHFAAVSSSDAAASSSLDWTTIAAWFPSTKVASYSVTDYVYDANYKDRGISSLPIRSLTLDPANPDVNNPLAKTETIYDNAIPTTVSGGYPILAYSTSNDYNCSSSYTPKTCWQNPNGPSGQINLSYRGLPTVSRVWNKDTNTWIETQTQYDQFGNVVKGKDPIGNEASTAYSAGYRYAYATSVTTPAPDPTGLTGTSTTSTDSTTYDFTTGLPLTVTDDFGQVSTTEYNDPLLRPTRMNPAVINGTPTGPVSETVYDDTARTVKVRKQLETDNWDESTTYLDTLGRTVKTVSRDSQGDITTETHYDSLGRVDRATSPYRAGDTVYWSKSRFDELGRVVETYAPATYADVTVSNNNNLVSLGTTSSAFSTFSDSNCVCIGMVVISTDASGRKSRSITNALGQLLRVDEPTAIGGAENSDLGALATPNQATYYKYDVFGKMVEVKQGNQHRYFKYDSLGRLLRIKQPEQLANSSLATTGDPFNNDWSAGFTYDVMGNVLTATDARGVKITNTYDRAGRVTSRTYSNEPSGQSTPAVTFRYDGVGLDSLQTPYNYAKGKLTKVSSTVSETKNTLFDKFGRPTETKQITDGTTYTSSYQYNLSGALVKEVYPSGREVKNDFESDGDLMRIYGKSNAAAQERTYANSFNYTPDGKIAKIRLGNGLWESAKFNTCLQPTEIALGHSAGDGSLWKLGYEYGELNPVDSTVNTAKNTGNIARQTVSFSGLANPFVQSYQYDALYRLKDAIETNNTSTTWSQHFDYDRFGNRTATNQTVNGLTINTNPAVDANTNRFTSASFGYDENGNLIRDVDADGHTRTIVLDGDNKQSVVKDAGGTPIGTYSYDGEGKRVKKVTQLETTVYVYSAGKLVEEYTTAAPPPTPTTNYTATDLLGSPRVLTNSLGEVVSRRDFLPFGEEIFADGTNRTTTGKYSQTDDDSVRKRFTGYEKDKETGLDFAEARMYENRYGRFTAVDPLIASGKSANPQTFNRYLYVLNSPLRLTDPVGLQAAQAPNLYWCQNDCEVSIDRKTNTATGNGEPLVNLSVDVHGGLWDWVLNDLLNFYQPGLQQISDTAQFGGTPDETSRVFGNRGFTQRNFFDYSNEYMRQVGELNHNALKWLDPTGQAAASRTAFDYGDGKASGFALGAATLSAVVAPLSFGSGGGVRKLESDTIRLYRGVPEEHEFIRLAEKGIAKPFGGHSDPYLHSVKENTYSIFTSWTTSPSIAIAHARYEGVVMVNTFQKSKLIVAPPAASEYEYLVTGIVKGSEVKRVMRIGFRW